MFKQKTKNEWIIGYMINKKSNTRPPPPPIQSLLYHERIQNVLSMGVQLCQHFCCSWREEGGSKYHLNRAIIGPPVKRHWNDVSLVVRWWSNNECWLGSLVIFRGSGLVLLRNPIALWFFRGDQNPCTPPSIWIRACVFLGNYVKTGYFCGKKDNGYFGRSLML